MIELIISLFIGVSISINGIITLRVIKKLEREGIEQQIASVQDIDITTVNSQPNLITK